MISDENGELWFCDNCSRDGRAKFIANKYGVVHEWESDPEWKLEEPTGEFIATPKFYEQVKKCYYAEPMFDGTEEECEKFCSSIVEDTKRGHNRKQQRLIRLAKMGDADAKTLCYASLTIQRAWRKYSLRTFRKNLDNKDEMSKDKTVMEWIREGNEIIESTYFVCPDCDPIPSGRECKCEAKFPGFDVSDKQYYDAFLDRVEDSEEEVEEALLDELPLKVRMLLTHLGFFVPQCNVCNSTGVARCTQCDYRLCNACFEGGKGYICWSDTNLCGQCDCRSDDPYFPNEEEAEAESEDDAEAETPLVKVSKVTATYDYVGLESVWNIKGDLDNAHNWYIKWDTLRVQWKEGDKYVEYEPNDSASDLFENMGYESQDNEDEFLSSHYDFKRPDNTKLIVEEMTVEEADAECDEP